MTDTAPFPTTEIAIVINGEPRRVAAGSSIAEMLMRIGFNPKKVAVERNREIVPRSTLGDVQLVSLKDVPLYRVTIPSKLQANMAATMRSRSLLVSPGWWWVSA